MKKTKKLLAGLLSLAMAVSMLPMSIASAAGENVVFELESGTGTESTLNSKWTTNSGDWTMTYGELGGDNVVKFERTGTTGTGQYASQVTSGLNTTYTNPIYEYGFSFMSPNVDTLALDQLASLQFNNNNSAQRIQYDSTKGIRIKKNTNGSYAEFKPMANTWADVKIYYDYAAKTVKVVANYTDTESVKHTNQTWTGTQGESHLWAQAAPTSILTRSAATGTMGEVFYLDDVYLHEVSKKTDDTNIKIVTFVSDDETYTTSSTIVNKLTTLPNDPEKAGSAFVEWNTKPDGTGDTFSAATTLSGDITVYAKWQEGTPVEFISNMEGIDNQTLTVAEGSVLPYLTAAGTTFIGWFIDNETFKVPFDASNLDAVADGKVYAKWDSEYLYYYDFESNAYPSAMNKIDGVQINSIETAGGNNFMRYDRSKGSTGLSKQDVFSFRPITQTIGRDTDYIAGYKINFNGKAANTGDNYDLGNFISVPLIFNKGFDRTGVKAASLAGMRVQGNKIIMKDADDGKVMINESPANINGFIDVEVEFNINGSKDTTTVGTPASGDPIGLLTEKNGVATIRVQYTKTDNTKVDETWTESFVSNYVFENTNCRIDRVGFINQLINTNQQNSWGQYDIDDLYLKVAPKAKVTFYTDNTLGTVHKTENITIGKTMTALPTEPESESAFAGWFYIKDGVEAPFTTDITVTADMTVYATWATTSRTVTFTADGVTVDTVAVGDGGTVATLPEAPQKDGWQFSHWEANGEAFTTATTVSADVTVTAVYDKLYTVTFVYNNGTENTTQETTGVVTLPTAPTKADNTFDGWYTDGGVEVKDGDTITADTTLTATWLPYNYYENFSDDTYAAPNNVAITWTTTPDTYWKYERKDGAATYTMDPTKTKVQSAFAAGWKNNIGFNSNNYPFELGYKVKVVNPVANFTVSDRLVWGDFGKGGGFSMTTTASGFTMTSDAGSVSLPSNTWISVRVVAVGQQEITYVTPEGGTTYTSTKAIGNTDGASGFQINGQIVTGQNLAADGTMSIMLDDVYIQKVDASAKKVTFDADNGTEVQEVNVYFDTITIPADPTKDSHEFVGWYVMDGETMTNEVFDGSKIVDGMVVKAKWIKAHTVSFEVQNENSTNPASIATTGKIDAAKLPTPTSSDGIVFAGWYWDAECTNAFDAAYDTIEKDTTLYAKWDTTIFYEDFADDDYTNGWSWATTNTNGYWTSTRSAEGYMVYTNNSKEMAPDNNNRTIFTLRNDNAAKGADVFEIGLKLKTENLAGYYNNLLELKPRFDDYVSGGASVTSSGGNLYVDTDEGSVKLDNTQWLEIKYIVNRIDGAGTVYYLNGDNTYTKTFTNLPVNYQSGFRISMSIWDSPAIGTDNTSIMLDDVYIKLPDQYEITFVDEVAGNQTATSKLDATVDLPTPAPTDGKVFVGWYKSVENGVYSEPFDGKGIMGEMTVYARWQGTPNYTIDLDGERNVPVTSSVNIAFDCEMDASTITADKFKVYANNTEIDYWTASAKTENQKTTATISFTRPLDLGTDYSVEILSGIVNLAGLEAEAYEAEFATPDLKLEIFDYELTDGGEAVTSNLIAKAGKTLNLNFAIRWNYE